MRSYLTTHLTIAFIAVLSAVLIIGSAWYVSHSLENIENQLLTHVDESRSTLKELATVTDRNGADALTERIIIDCPRRTEFEELLNGLGSASQKELISAQQLFESCGAFYAERKALMVAQIEREFENLEKSLLLLSKVRDLTIEERALSKWKEFIELERTRSNFLGEQTKIQEEIIALLIQGGTSRSRIEELSRQAANINQSLGVTDAQIDELRSTLP